MELANPDYRLEPVARTFHGRDVFAPGGGAPRRRCRARASSARPSPPPSSCASTCPRRASARAGSGRRCVYVDRFGNVQLNLTRDHLAQVGIEPGSKLEIEVGFERYYAVAARTFAEVKGGDIVLYEDAYWNISLAINRGNAAEMFGVSAGDELKISAAEW